MTPHPTVITAAFLSTGLISLAPNILLFLFPNYGASSSGQSDDRGRAILSLGQSLAVGGLLGDVFLHTLPEFFDNSTQGHHHNEAQHHHDGDGGDIGLRIIAGFSAFLILDIIVRSFEEKSGGGHSHSHNHSSVAKKKKGANATSNEGACKENEQQPWRLLLSSAVLLNLLGDALHNFTDGLAIGATFSVTHISDSSHSHSSIISWTTSAFSLLKSRGGLVSTSVFLHEIPHELGDFATLVRAGLTRNMAIGAQFLTAIAAFLGTAFGLFSGQIIEGLGHEILLPFTAGGFLYLACVTILPDVLETNASMVMRILQVGSFLLGVLFMYAVAEMEEAEAAASHDNHHHHHHHSQHNHNYHSEL